MPDKTEEEIKPFWQNYYTKLTRMFLKKVNKLTL